MSNTLSSKYSKFPALQGTFSAVQNMVSFSIPAGDKYDLSEAAVLLDLQVQTTETNAVNLPQYEGGSGVYRLSVGFNDDSNGGACVVPTCALVKNADLESRMAGQIESLQRCDTLNIALKQYEQSIEHKRGDAYFGLASSAGMGAFNNSPFTQLSKLGSVKSRVVPHSVRIPLKDVFNFCNTPVYDTNKYGETRVRLEMNLDKLVVLQDLSRTGSNWNSKNYEDFDSPPTNSGTATVSSFTTTNAYENPERDSPFYVGMKINMEYIITPQGGSAVPYNFSAGNARERIIQSIVWNANNDNKLTITIDNGIATSANDAWSAVKFQAVDPATKTFVYNKIELELKQVSDPSPAGISYFTYETEQDTGFSGTNSNKQYTCSPMTDNMLICCPDDIIPKKVITGLRVSIDNVEETPEKVTTFSSLYYDRQNRFWFNMGGGDLKCLRDEADATSSAIHNNPNLQVIALGQPLPIKNEQKQVQLDMDHGNNDMERLHLYKRVQKSI